jgi:transposase InsO family protein
MQSHEIPERPWSRLGTDLFTLQSKDYIVLVDYYSDYIEVSPLKDTTSATLVKFLKVQFSRHGIPDVLVSDNGPQYVSNEFAEFARAWEFQHLTSSPYHPKSNGKAESAVKVVKGLFKQAIKDHKDPWLALLDYRNTPTQGMQTSPVQRLVSRRTKTLVP